METLGDGFTAAETGIVARRVAECAQDEAVPDPSERWASSASTTSSSAWSSRRYRAGTPHRRPVRAARAVPFFANPANVVSFALHGLEDFERDVFFLLHAVAVALAEAVEEVTATLENRAGSSGRRSPPHGRRVRRAEESSAASARASPRAARGDGDPPPADHRRPRRLSDPHFQAAYERIRRFALLAGKLGMDETEVAVAFHDQDLTGKYPEPLALPPGVDVIDAVLRGSDGRIYVFAGDVYWALLATRTPCSTPGPRH